MGKELVIKPRAFTSINKIVNHIFKEGYPETSKKFKKELIQFAVTLTYSAESFNICRHKPFYKRKNKCIPFKKNYIFIVSITETKIVIHNVVPAKLIR